MFCQTGSTNTSHFHNFCSIRQEKRREQNNRHLTHHVSPHNVLGLPSVDGMSGLLVSGTLHSRVTQHTEPMLHGQRASSWPIEKVNLARYHTNHRGFFKFATNTTTSGRLSPELLLFELVQAPHLSRGSSHRPGDRKCCGKWRCAANQWKRIWKGRRSAKRVNRLCRTNSKAQKLTSTVVGFFR